MIRRHATSASALVAAMADRPGVKHRRTTRGANPVLYPDGGQFPIGGSKVLKPTGADQVTLIGAGVTLHNCIAAAKTLGEEGIPARVIDLYFIKPIDAATLAAAAGETGRLVLVEDHHPKADSARLSLRGWPNAGSAAPQSHIWPLPTCLAQGRRRNCSLRPASPPPISPQRHGH